MELVQFENEAIVDFFRSYLKQVVTLHHAMFEKLLFSGKGIPLELAELFEDAGNTYLDISEQISKRYQDPAPSEIEQ
ncbi:MAG TPA: hypothetical protein VMG39_13895 [Pseudolabrys sp.]|nr:hypothetical protein [Pseudolabrys sp.]